MSNEQSVHTPGPLKISRYIDGDFVAVYPDTGKVEFPVAVKPKYMRDDVWASYAALFAAAPELLAACIWAEAAIAPFSKEPAEKSGIALLRAAIARARLSPSSDVVEG